MRTVEDAKSVMSKLNELVGADLCVTMAMRQKVPNRQLAAASAAWLILTAEATPTASKINARTSSLREPHASSLHGAPQENVSPTLAVPWAEMVSRRRPPRKTPS